MRIFFAAILSLSTLARAQAPAPSPPTEDPPAPSAPATAEPGTEAPAETVAAPAPPVEGPVTPAQTAVKKKDNTPAYTVLAQTNEAAARITGWRFFTSLSHDVGAGTFTNIDRADARYIGGGLSLGATYLFSAFNKKLAASASGALGWEYTQPDLVNGRRFDWGDIRLGLSAPAIFRDTKFTGVSLTPRFGATLPISLRSRRASTITVLSLGADLTRTVKRFDFIYRLSASRGLHAQTFVGTTAASVGDPTPFQSKTVLCRGADTFCDYGGQNNAWSLGNMLAATWRATDSFALSAAFVVQNNWRYPVALEVDEFTPKALDSNGNPVARAGYGRVDAIQASLGASYAFSEILQASFGIGFDGTPLNNDNRSVRSPFAYPAGNYLSFSLGLSALF